MPTSAASRHLFLLYAENTCLFTLTCLAAFQLRLGLSHVAAAEFVPVALLSLAGLAIAVQSTPMQNRHLYRPHSRPGVAVCTMAVPVGLAANLVVTANHSSEYWRLLWLSIAAGNVCLANLLTVGSPVSAHAFPRCGLAAALATSTTFLSSAAVPSWLGTTLVLILFQMVNGSLLHNFPKSFSAGEAHIVAQLITAVLSNFVLSLVSSMSPSIGALFGLAPLVSLQHPLVLIAHYVLVTTMLVVGAASPLLHVVQQLDGAANKKDDDADGSDDEADSQDEVGEDFDQRALPELYARIMLISVLAYFILTANLRRDPAKCVAMFLLERPLARLGLCGFWALCILTAVASFKSIASALHLRLIVSRKLYHGLALLMFIPGVLFEVELLSLAFVGALCLLCLVELFRVGQVPPCGAAIDSFMRPYTDSKDAGCVILSHLYLVVGCALPVWLHLNALSVDADLLLPALAGVISVGAADAVASVVGSSIGRLRWPGSAKTVEGSAASFLSIIGVLYLVDGLVPQTAPSWPSVAASAGLISVIEGVTDSADNLVLPLYAYAAMLLL